MAVGKCNLNELLDRNDTGNSKLSSQHACQSESMQHFLSKGGAFLASNKLSNFNGCTSSR